MQVALHKPVKSILQSFQVKLPVGSVGEELTVADYVAVHLFKFQKHGPVPVTSLQAVLCSLG